MQIAQGWGVPCIGDELHAPRRDRPVVVFNVYARLQRRHQLQGRHVRAASKNMGVRSAVKALKAGPHIAYVKLTIPPGFWLQEIAARVGKLPGLDSRHVRRGDAEQRGALRVRARRA